MSETPKDAKDIFLAALDIQDAAKRAEFVERSCDGDEALRQRVEDLLRAYGEPDGPLDKLAAALAPTQLGEPIREQVGATIGSYKLMEQIGEGGFGLVFVAEQERPIRRKVALKIIKPGMDTRDVIARFEAERQALALMDHPNIARVLDAGTTDSGRPYFVMELVRGIPITEYCDQTQLTPRERLGLFIDVCNAIQHAHLKGIIHRDVKPSNVLITLHDDRPVVKVIDFGVAKALYQSLTERTIYTRYAQMIGTPLYMSPEQAQMSGLDIDTRSDIYSLGVLLYELLTGSTPFNKERLAKAAYDELLKIIREEEPPKPSVRLSQSTDTLPSIAAQRKTEPAKLSKMFHGDLDWIAMKALEKDRIRRYETANAFAADVLRYLNDEPVEASPPSTAYRLRKFGRKHRKPVIALAAIMAVLVLGIAGTTWGLFRAQRAEQAAGVSKQQAVDALGQTTKERDAKESALADVAAQRDQAERELAKGLLRPIGIDAFIGKKGGIFGRATAEANPAELRSIVDWSGLTDSRSKSRVLEVAFEDPETALRVARRAERVIQASVGLSPRRRARAIEFLSARQRDMSVDPSIRVAACWLALELGSADLTAWPESCSYLGNKLPDRFDEFVDFAISRRDPRQIAQLSADPLLQLLATSAVAGPKAFSALADCASQLDSAQAARALQIVLSSSVNSRQNIFGAVGIKSLVGRLEPTQRARTAEAILEMLDQLLHREDWPLPWIFPTLWEFGPHLDHAQHVRVAEMLIARLDKLRGASSEYVTGHQPEITHILFQLGPLTKLTVPQAAHIRDTLTAIAAKLGGMGEGLIAVLPWLDEAQAQRIVQRFTDGSLAAGAFEEVATLAPRIQSVQAGRAWDLIIKRVKSPPHHPNNMAALPDPAPAVLQALASRLNSAKIKEEATASIATLETSADSHAVGRSLIALMALTPRLERAQVNRVGNALIGQLKKGTDDELVEARTWALETLIPRFEPAQAKGAWDVLVTMPSNWFSEDLAAIVPRMESRDVEAAANDIIAILRKPLPQSRNSSGLVSALSTLAPRLTPAQAQRAASALMALGQPGTGFGSTVPAFGALLTRIDAEYASKIGDALIATLETTTDTKARFEAMTELVELVPKLEPAQVPRAWKVLSANFSDATAWDALPAVVARLEPLSRDVESTRAATVLLDHACCDRVVWNSSVEFAPYISSPRALAKLLSHPGCVGEEREYLLRRFEELALYEGKAVFPKLQRREGSGARFIEVKADSGKQPSPAPPPRRFHNLHDAAAWIQQNWPDFDLETNCPVTWRGSR